MQRSSLLRFPALQRSGCVELKLPLPSAQVEHVILLVLSEVLSGRSNVIPDRATARSFYTGAILSRKFNVYHPMLVVFVLVPQPDCFVYYCLLILSFGPLAFVSLLLAPICLFFFSVFQLHCGMCYQGIDCIEAALQWPWCDMSLTTSKILFAHW